MKMKIVMLMAVLCVALFSSQLLAWEVKVTGHPSGGYVASLVHSSDPTKNETVGHYETKKEAKKAGKKAKKAKGFKAEDTGPCAGTMTRC
jgi:hypothetical protein